MTSNSNDTEGIVPAQVFQPNPKLPTRVEPKTGRKKVLNKTMVGPMRDSSVVKSINKYLMDAQKTAIGAKVQKIEDQIKAYSSKTDRDFIPCLYIAGRSDKILIHFHANGEDISSSESLLQRIRREFRVSVICVEYPGYGLYRHSSKKRST